MDKASRRESLEAQVASFPAKPGVYLFRMAGGFVDLVRLGEKAPVDLLLNTIADGTTAMLIILAMAFGLILPKMCIEHLYPSSSAVEPHGKTTAFHE